MKALLNSIKQGLGAGVTLPAPGVYQAPNFDSQLETISSEAVSRSMLSSA